MTAALAVHCFPTVAADSPAFNQDRAYSDLIRQCEFGPRVPGTAGHALCGRWLADELYRYADEVRLQRLTVAPHGTPLPLVNIIATFNPQGNSHVILAAHWDTRPTADCDPNPENRDKAILGANDGASGVAILLEVARTLKRSPPKQRVSIVLFDGEDYGPTPKDMFLGSRYFAQHYTGPPVEWAVLLDMVGDRDLRIPKERFSLDHAPHVVDRVWSAARRVSAAAFVNKPGKAVLDDHVFLQRQGIPCIDVIDFDYPYWHTLADTPDKCAPNSLGQVGRAVLAALDEHS